MTLCIFILFEIDDLYRGKAPLYLVLDLFTKSKDIQQLIRERKLENPKEKDEKRDEFKLAQAGICLIRRKFYLETDFWEIALE